MNIKKKFDYYKLKDRHRNKICPVFLPFIYGISILKRKYILKIIK